MGSIIVFFQDVGSYSAEMTSYGREFYTDKWPEITQCWIIQYYVCHNSKFALDSFWNPKPMKANKCINRGAEC